MEELTSKKRANLRSLATNLDPVVQIGKGLVSDASVEAVEEAFHTRELLKVAVLDNANVDLRETAETLAERTKSTVVAVTGRKIILYKVNPKLRQEAAEKAKRAKQREEKIKQAKKESAKESKSGKKTYDKKSFGKPGRPTKSTSGKKGR